MRILYLKIIRYNVKLPFLYGYFFVKTEPRFVNRNEHPEIIGRNIFLIKAIAHFHHLCGC